MNVLTIDSSTTKLTLALYANGHKYSCCEEVGSTHSDVIITKIQALLQSAKITIRLIDLIAYNAGPGSFTGLRIGISVALGIAYGLGVKIAAIDSFLLVAYALLDQGLIDKDKLGVALDARLQQVYFAQLDVATFNYINQPIVVKPDQVSYSSDVLYIGDGFTRYKELFDSRCYINYRDVPKDMHYALLDYVLKNYKTISLEAKEAPINYVRNNIAQENITAAQLQPKSPLC